MDFLHLPSPIVRKIITFLDALDAFNYLQVVAPRNMPFFCIARDFKLSRPFREFFDEGLAKDLLLFVRHSPVVSLKECHLSLPAHSLTAFNYYTNLRILDVRGVRLTRRQLCGLFPGLARVESLKYWVVHDGESADLELSVLAEIPYANLRHLHACYEFAPRVRLLKESEKTQLSEQERSLVIDKSDCLWVLPPGSCQTLLPLEELRLESVQPLCDPLNLKNNLAGFPDRLEKSALNYLMLRKTILKCVNPQIECSFIKFPSLQTFVLNSNYLTIHNAEMHVFNAMRMLRGNLSRGMCGDKKHDRLFVLRQLQEGHVRPWFHHVVQFRLSYSAELNLWNLNTEMKRADEVGGPS